MSQLNVPIKTMLGSLSNYLVLHKHSNTLLHHTATMGWGVFIHVHDLVFFFPSTCLQPSRARPS